MVLATLLALAPWVGLLLDATDRSDNPPGTPTTANCDTAFCFPSMAHIVLKGTLGPAAICAGVAIAVAAVVLARRRALWWPLVVIVLAAVAMILYAAFL